MKIKRLSVIPLDNKYLPYKWKDNLIANQEIGGVFLVFLSGKDSKEVDLKVKLLKEFIKTIKSKVKDLTNEI